jgi:WD40 repeat protein
VAFSPDGRHLASGVTNGRIKLWDAASLEELRTIKAHTGPVTCLAFSPDSSRLVSGSPNTNCIAVIMKHVAGNLLSRWTDFLTTDGEKPWRNRDDETVNGGSISGGITFRDASIQLAGANSSSWGVITNGDHWYWKDCRALRFTIAAHLARMQSPSNGRAIMDPWLRPGPGPGKPPMTLP